MASATIAHAQPLQAARAPSRTSCPRWAGPSPTSSCCWRLLHAAPGARRDGRAGSAQAAAVALHRHLLRDARAGAAVRLAVRAPAARALLPVCTASSRSTSPRSGRFAAGVPPALALVFFVWVSVFNLFVVSVFWSFMADLFDDGAGRAAVRRDRRRRQLRRDHRPALTRARGAGARRGEPAAGVRGDARRCVPCILAAGAGRGRYPRRRRRTRRGAARRLDLRRREGRALLALPARHLRLSPCYTCSPPRSTSSRSRSSRRECRSGRAHAAVRASTSR